MKKRPQRKKGNSVAAFARDLLGYKRILIFLAAFLFFFLLISQREVERGSVFGVQTSFFERPVLRADPFTLPTPALYPKKATDVSPPSVSAQSAIVLDATSQVILYKKNEDVRFPPASTTKIMTALVGMEYFQPSDILSVNGSTNVEGSTMKLVEGERMTFENLLFGLLLNSGNDAAETIAQNSPGGRDGFIARMNEKAGQLHLENTHFEDVTGIAFENHYTTALDLARLASAALQNGIFARIVATKAKTVSDVSGRYLHNLENINKLLGSVAGVEGVKTGYTEEAGQVLVAAATRNGHTIISVVLRSQDRFLDSTNLLEWAFANYTFTEATLP
jgi:D-alanyl-D-alanine carboxypeptidase (penicillin-binding protein 5/6)